jgi:hypothetical protein
MAGIVFPVKNVASMLITVANLAALVKRQISRLSRVKIRSPVRESIKYKDV